MCSESFFDLFHTHLYTFWGFFLSSVTNSNDSELIAWERQLKGGGRNLPLPLQFLQNIRLGKRLLGNLNSTKETVNLTLAKKGVPQLH